MTTRRTTKLVLALISVLAMGLSVPLAAHAKGTIGHSTESTNGLVPATRLFYLDSRRPNPARRPR